MADIPYFEDFISPELRAYLLQQARPVPSVSGLTQIGEGGGLENAESLMYLCELYDELKTDLASILNRRTADRAFIDQRCRALSVFNHEHKRDYQSADYRTILGLEDSEGRIVIGPKRADYVKKGGAPIAPLPHYLQGPHVTLFGPPDSAKLAVNAMNAYHRQLPGEPVIVGDLLRSSVHAPKWGADDEDSKTPLRADLVSAGENLSRCFDGSLIAIDEKSGKRYEIHKEKRAQPIKRFPGLALPCTFLFRGDNPIPLHLYDFALHFYQNWRNPEALVFYVPKLEHEEEARYIHLMMDRAEKLLKVKHPDYRMGQIRLMIVLENPRAIFRTHEIMDELYPYFAGASLGWHDYLASTARIFKEDSQYRIPAKSDPNIVIKYIKASHRLLADVVGPRGGIKVGGMYGVLPLTPDLASASFQVTLKGYIKDVVTQLKRDLTGYWVAHPDFVRLGLALVEAWKLRTAGDAQPLRTLVTSLLQEQHASEVLAFIDKSDIEGLDPDDPLYARSLIVADRKESENAKNNHPDEIRYNVFQCLQYLADWLSGRGCVALPAELEGVPVRVMDDLATTERSRWEVWHEIRHGRFALEDFLRIAFEELHFIRKNQSNARKIVQVKWDEQSARWYPIAFKIMIRLMTDAQPVEFSSELLLSLTVESIREAADPWETLRSIDPQKYRFDPYVDRFLSYFECLGNQSFAQSMAVDLVPDLAKGEALVKSFSLAEVIAAAAFHGDIGEGKQTLDAMALQEQAKVLPADEALKSDLRARGQTYLNKFGVKFLVSAAGKSAAELKHILEERIGNTKAEELNNARVALWEIACKRLKTFPIYERAEVFQKIQAKHSVPSAMISLLSKEGTQNINLNCSPHTWFEVASLSKSVASAFALEYFSARKIGVDTSVNQLLAQTSSSFRLSGPYGDAVTLAHLMSHKALNMHYVKGIPATKPMPALDQLINGSTQYGYEPILVINPPGEVFQYSGAGFLLLEHLIELMEKRSIRDLTRPFLDALGMQDFSFHQESLRGQVYADGIRDDGQLVEGKRLMFPAFAAGGMGTSAAIAAFLTHLGQAYHSLEGSGPISHDTARSMLYGTDLGCQAFMGCNMGLGVFIAEAGDNRMAIHQGANDGFRCLYIYCFAGPDRGKGLVTLCNGELKGVLFNSEIAQEALKLFGMKGIDFSRFTSHFSKTALKEEEIVNIGYRDLLIKAFEPRLPEKIVSKGLQSPLAAKNRAVGGKTINVSNQLFARAENLLSPYEPVFDPHLFGKEGKIMDSWETVRHNQRGFDDFAFELLAPAPIRYISLSTKFHFGNHAPTVSLEGRVNGQWREILGKTYLDGHALKCIDRGLDHSIYSAVRVQIYPDGGLSRLGLYSNLSQSESLNYRSPTEAQSLKFSDPIPLTLKPLNIPYTPDEAEISRNRALIRPGQLVDLASMALGGKVLYASNEHYGPAIQLNSPFPPLNMFDGLESARSRIPGHQEEALIRLAKPSRLHQIVVDFRFFVNNNPRELALQGLCGSEWIELIPRSFVKSFAGTQKAFAVTDTRLIEELRVQTFPDGGLNRLKAMSYWE